MRPDPCADPVLDRQDGGGYARRVPERTAVIETAMAFVFGLLIGSFLNVCIYRWPRGLSVVRPRSACPACEATIAWYDNVPLVSFVLLGGRCRHCRAAISWRYPVIELLTGIAFA